MASPTWAERMQHLPRVLPRRQLPELISASGREARERFVEFFTVHIRNPNTRSAVYARAAVDFLTWLHETGMNNLAAIQPVHVATWIEQLAKDGLSAPTIKQRLAAVRMLFNWLVVGQIVATNPATAVRGPKHVVKRGKTAAAVANRDPPADRCH